MDKIGQPSKDNSKKSTRNIDFGTRRGLTKEMRRDSLSIEPVHGPEDKGSVHGSRAATSYENLTPPSESSHNLSIEHVDDPEPVHPKLEWKPKKIADLSSDDDGKIDRGSPFYRRLYKKFYPETYEKCKQLYKEMWRLDEANLDEANLDEDYLNRSTKQYRLSTIHGAFDQILGNAVNKENLKTLSDEDRVIYDELVSSANTAKKDATKKHWSKVKNYQNERLYKDAVEKLEGFCKALQERVEAEFEAEFEAEKHRIIWRSLDYLSKDLKWINKLKDTFQSIYEVNQDIMRNNIMNSLEEQRKKLFISALETLNWDLSDAESIDQNVKVHHEADINEQARQFSTEVVSKVLGIKDLDTRKEKICSLLEYVHQFQETEDQVKKDQVK